MQDAQQLATVHVGGFDLGQGLVELDEGLDDEVAALANGMSAVVEGDADLAESCHVFVEVGAQRGVDAEVLEGFELASVEADALALERFTESDDAGAEGLGDRGGFGVVGRLGVALAAEESVCRAG